MNPRLFDLLTTLAVDARVAATAELEGRPLSAGQEAILDRVVSVWGVPAEDDGPTEGAVAAARFEAELNQIHRLRGRWKRGRMSGSVPLVRALETVWAGPVEQRWDGLSRLVAGSAVTLAEARRMVRERDVRRVAALLVWGEDPPVEAVGIEWLRAYAPKDHWSAFADRNLLEVYEGDVPVPFGRTLRAAWDIEATRQLWPDKVAVLEALWGEMADFTFTRAGVEAFGEKHGLGFEDTQSMLAQRGWRWDHDLVELRMRRVGPC